MTDDLFDFPDRPCSMARQIGVMVGALSAAGVVGVLIAVAAWRQFIGEWPR